MTELLDAVDELTLPKPVKVTTDTGFTWATEDPLLVQLEEAIRSTTGRTGGRSASHTRMILDADALMRFHQITSAIGDWCRIENVKATRDPVKDLRAWHVARMVKTEESNEFYVSQLVGWALLIRGKLAPPVTLEYLSPCPVCKAETWVNDDGDEFLHPVQVSYEQENPFATVRWECRACGTSRSGEFAQRALAYDAETHQESE